MQVRKQKFQSSKRISTRAQAVTLTVEQYRTLIVLPQFSLKQTQTYNTFASLQLAALETSTIEVEKLKELAVDTLKLTFIYDPLRDSLLLQYRKIPTHISLKVVLRILTLGEFYRFINNNENQIKILINNKTTELNVKILIASLFVLASRKLTLQQISTALLFFSLEAALNNNDTGTLPVDSQRILKVLKKIERVIKPLEFKAWMESVKNAKQFTGSIEPHQFLYLCSLAQRKFTNGLRYMIFQPKMSALFRNLNSNTKVPELQLKLQQKDIPGERRIVKGLTFISPRKHKQRSFSKQILKQFRLKDPSKHQRPDTAYLRRHVRSFANLNELRSYETQKQNGSRVSTFMDTKSTQINSLHSNFHQGSSKLTKKNMRRKTDLKLIK